MLHLPPSQDAIAVRGHGGCRTLFLHAGLRASHARAHGTVGALNAEVRRQIVAGEREGLLDSHDGPLWFRGYARPTYLEGGGEPAAALDDASLARLEVKKKPLTPHLIPRCIASCFPDET